MPPKADPYNTPVHRRIDLVLFAVVFAIVAILLSTSAHAQTPRLITYFNFEDSTRAPGPTGTGVVNLQSDPAVPAPEQSSTITFGTGLTSPSGVTSVSAVAGTTLNIAPGNIQGTDSALRLSETKFKDNAYIQFTVSTIGLQSLSLSYATQATGIFKQTLSYSVNGGAFTNFSTQTVTGTFSTITFDLSSVTAINNQATVTFRITVDSTGVNQNSGATADFDNIQLKAVPEPSTVGAAALSVLGLCWHQRRRVAKARQLLSFSRKPPPTA